MSSHTEFRYSDAFLASREISLEFILSYCDMRLTFAPFTQVNDSVSLGNLAGIVPLRNKVHLLENLGRDVLTSSNS